MAQPFAFSIESPAAQAIGTAATVEGVEVQRFLKPVIPVGRFVKRGKDGRKIFELDVTPARQQGWVDTFKAMKQNGVAVKVMDETGNFTIEAPKAVLSKNHAGAWDKGQKRLAKLAENVVGETVDMFVDGNWLNAVVEVKGRESIDLVQRNKDTSPEIDPCRIDGTEQKYGEAITAISIVANPLIPGQTGFERIAASADSPERFILSLDNEEPMKLAAILAAVASLACLDTSKVTEDNAVDTLNGVKAKLTDTESRLTKALSADEPHDKTVLGMTARLAEKEIGTLKGIVSDAGIAKLKAALVGDLSKEQYSSYILSQDEPLTAVKSVEDLCKIIRENPAVKAGVKTELQKVTPVTDPVALSDDDGAASAADKVVDAHISAVYGKRAKEFVVA